MSSRQFILGHTVVFLLLLSLWAASYSYRSYFMARLFVDTYWMLPLMSGILGIFGARIWGIRRNYVGYTILAYSSYMLLHSIGLLGYSIEAALTGTENPFPSINELFFVLASISQSVGTLYIVKTFFVQVDQIDLAKRRNYFYLSLFLGMLVASWICINIVGTLRLDLASVLTVFYISLDSVVIIVLTFTCYFSKAIFRGEFVNNIRLTTLAFLLLGLANVSFLVEYTTGVWKVSCLSDFLYLTGYFILGLSLYKLSFKYYRDHSGRILVLFSYTSLFSAHVFLFVSNLFSSI